MSIFRFGGSLIIVALVLSAGAQGQTKAKTTIVALANGTKFEGAVVKESKDQIVFETELGRRVVPAAEIASRESAAPVRAEYESRAAKFPSGQIAAREALAAWARDRGLTSAFAAEASRLFDLDPAHETAWKWVRSDAPLYDLVANPQPTDKDRWVRAQIDLLFETAAKASFVKAALARVQLEGLDPELVTAAGVKHVKSGSAPVRWLAVAVLGGTRDVRRVKPLYNRALCDGIAAVRQEAVASLKRSAKGEFIGPFLANLSKNEQPLVRLYAAEALGAAGDARAVPGLINALAALDAGARPLAHQNIVVTTQTAYVKDYDVEVAQSAFIADPIVDVVQEGAVLDAALISVDIQKRVIGNSLRRLSGRDFGVNVKAWRAYWEDEAKKTEREGNTTDLR